MDDGGSGDVYVGEDTLTGRRVLLKQLKKMSQGELKYNLNSVYFEQILRDSVYIERPLDVVRHTNGRVTFVYRYEESIEFKLSKRILKQLFMALDYAHQRGIMHRDVKPANIIVYPQSKAHLIDWNLASLFYFSKENDVELGTIIYEAPEMLLNYPYYHYSIDLWGIGVTMLEYYYDFRFQGDTREQVLESVVRLFGTNVLEDFVEKYKLNIDGCLKRLLKKQYPRRGLRSIRPVRYVSPRAFDLMERLLTFDHNERLLAKEAINHPYFTNRRMRKIRRSSNRRRNTTDRI